MYGNDWHPHTPLFSFFSYYPQQRPRLPNTAALTTNPNTPTRSPPLLLQRRHRRYCPPAPNAGSGRARGQRQCSGRECGGRLGLLPHFPRAAAPRGYVQISSKHKRKTPAALSLYRVMASHPSFTTAHTNNPQNARTQAASPPPSPPTARPRHRPFCPEPSSPRRRARRQQRSRRRRMRSRCSSPWSRR